MAQTVQFTEYGDLDVLRVVDAPPPAPAADHVQIAVRAAGVNPVDWKIVTGEMREVMPVQLPAGVGSDVAGVVTEVGAGVTEWAVGDEVLGRSTTPAFSEYALAQSADLVRKPHGITWEVAGSLAGAGGTAYAVLKRLGVDTGDTLLVHAAAGGVGTFTVQLAKARGLTVLGTASERNHDYLRSIGAIPVTYGDGLLDRVRAAAPQGVDAVLDASGRGEIPMSIELTGNPAKVLTLVAFDAADTGIQIHVDGAGRDLGAALREIVDLIEQQRLTVGIARAFPLADTAAALHASRDGHVSGKIVVLPSL
ncbi:NADP-dependent oxidoreductase [Mycolicibacterium litorale]|uniref:Oxidoreductase n=1 Tax=Mycolicibacterium litorale TaxID=758802 RepID=A0AAD1MWM6_9MYCO|nr:NADP-dependent oxidoreductase [Mycolicibacterium litorale]MCV7417446.1 NADP-dependent oxidoreductase [Mycolicibacterium litorale]TDY05235.1 NADPH:quinone reductase-like Zn-dependent oxidoreductase [Mycolicibacterium litorale]BBY18672.1 oxidoreductase [Mycolicibacterium litorale]